MNSLDHYQEWAETKVKYQPEVEMEYLHLGLSEEVGELNGKRAKALRKGDDVDVQAVALELGDILWFTAQLASKYGYYLSDIAEMNMAKLEGRAIRGTIVGSGDYR